VGRLGRDALSPIPTFGVERIDIFFLHEPDAGSAIDERLDDFLFDSMKRELIGTWVFRVRFPH